MKNFKLLILFIPIFMYSCGESDSERLEKERIENIRIELIVQKRLNEERLLKEQEEEKIKLAKKKEEQKRTKIEGDISAILVKYNSAIRKHKKAVNGVYEAANYFGWSNSDLITAQGVYWQQDGWDTLMQYYNLNQLEDKFLNNYGEVEYNSLKLKIDNNINAKLDF